MSETVAEPPGFGGPDPNLAASRHRPSWLRRHDRPLLFGLAAVLVFGAGVGVGVAASDSGTSRAALASPASKGKAHGHRGTRATIVSEAGTTWIVRTPSGHTLTVTLTPKTKFGTKKAPATVTQFTRGDMIVIGGTVNSDTITATRIATPAKGGARTPARSASPSG